MTATTTRATSLKAFTSVGGLLEGHHDVGDAHVGGLGVAVLQEQYTAAFTATPNPTDEVAGERRGYGYDPIGNRDTALDQDGTTQITYAANELNQYDLIDQRAPSYDEDGNLLADGTRVLSYNAENQLKSVTVPGASVSTYDYDYLGRRVRKRVHFLNGSSSDYTSTWVYDGWNKVEETKSVSGGVTTTKNFVWGLDLSQSTQGAGGIGGLLVAMDGSGSASLFAYDGNGNVSELIDGATGSTEAHYEYDAFGDVILATGALASENNYRFSTKYADDETGLVYYGYRYLDTGMGRWVKRDPAGTEGGLNAYSLTQNAPLNYIEFLGLIPDTEAEVREAMRRAIEGSRVTLADVLKLLRDFYTDGPAFLFFGEAIHQVVFEKYRSIHGLRGVLTDRTVAEVFRDALRPGEHPRGSGGLRPDIVNLNTQELYEVKSVRGQVQAEQEAQAYAVALSKLCINV